VPRPAASRLRATRAHLRLPNGWIDAARQVAIWLAIDSFYELVRGFAEGNPAEAFVNGKAVAGLEQATGTFFEVDLQRAMLHHRWIVDIADFLYMNAHFVLTTAFLTWLYMRRNESFYFVRNMFIAAMGMAVVVHMLLPTAPPRLLTQYGFVDTVDQVAHVDQDSGAISLLVNKYAAVPSMHVGFALMVGVTAIALSRRRGWRFLWAGYPLLVLFVVIVTANHFWLDAAAGATVAVVAALLARGPLTRLRPEVWAWRVVGRGEGEHQPAAAPARI
jgi:uncharacterized membrane protein